ncbi:MAG: class I SAM-dependent methyltransferase, partial [Nitrosopumilus sp.]|nr:class I SAM-dependent methyltransferase [Nitrosopumilus sp.]
MDELVVKKNFADIYTQKFPDDYLEEMKRLHYRIPDKTKTLYLSLAEQLYKKLSRPINILDIGSSYGINAALMKHDLEMSDLDDYFLQEENTTLEQTKQFFEKMPSNDHLKFFQIDISDNALQFSEDVKLCKKGICVNLETESLPIKEVPSFDMIIATGCIGYIGYRAFSNLFELIKKQQTKYSQSEIEKPVFAFSVLRIFDMEKIQQTFDYYGYSLVRTDLDPIRQRRFSDSGEKSQTVSLLHSKGIDSKGFEDDEHFYAH